MVLGEKKMFWRMAPEMLENERMGEGTRTGHRHSLAIEEGTSSSYPLSARVSSLPPA